MGDVGNQIQFKENWREVDFRKRLEVIFGKIQDVVGKNEDSSDKLNILEILNDNLGNSEDIWRKLKEHSWIIEIIAGNCWNWI